MAAGGTAATAGLRGGDIIVRLNNHMVSSLEDLEGMVTALKPGTPVTLYYTRGADDSVHTGGAKLGTLSP